MSDNLKKNLSLICLLAVVTLLAGNCTAEERAAPRSWMTVQVRAHAGKWEAKAAEDLTHYLSLMSGKSVILVKTDKLLKGQGVIVGQLALDSSSKLRELLTKSTKPQPVIRSDAIALFSQDDKIYLAGSNDDSHYFAASYLLQKLGCRWYIPTELGECIPSTPNLKLPTLSYSYSPPFEARSYWVSWMGDSTGYEEFAKRNYFNLLHPGGGGSHALDQYLEALPKGTALSSPEAADFLLSKVEAKYSKSQPLSVGISDAVQRITSLEDSDLIAKIWDKYFKTPEYADVVATLYQNLIERLKAKYPKSTSIVSFLIYTNATLPPQRQISLESPLVGYIAPIDTDPNHSIKSGRSQSKLDYYGALQRWNKVLNGRLVVYDYDQGMLVWRDLPNPSHMVVRDDVKTYRDLGILGIDTESRHAFASTFLNLYFRGQLYWDPDFDTDSALKEFYPKYYGSAGQALEEYWTQIYKAWETTSVTEHEFFAIPKIYTTELVAALGNSLAKASEEGLTSVQKRRLEATRLQFSIIEHYVAMVTAGASECRYAEAASQGQQGLDDREKLLTMNPLWVTLASNIGARGPAWWPGEVDYYRELAALQKSKLKPTPHNWHFRLDPGDHGTWRNWASEDPENWPGQARTDLYLQAQDNLDIPKEVASGYGWYGIKFQVTEANTGTHLYFPGLLQEAWLYLDGNLVEHRAQKDLWWRNDYKFNWDVSLPQLNKGEHTLALRVPIDIHMSGMFRRPFFYRPSK